MDDGGFRRAFFLRNPILGFRINPQRFSILPVIVRLSPFDALRRWLWHCVVYAGISSVLSLKICVILRFNACLIIFYSGSGFFTWIYARNEGDIHDKQAV